VSKWRVNWDDEGIKRKIRRAQLLGVNEVMSYCVNGFQGNHPGWVNRNFKAERSVVVQRAAYTKGNGVAGEWGSRGVVYFRKLEVEHGGALRASATREYPKLESQIRKWMR